MVGRVLSCRGGIGVAGGRVDPWDEEATGGSDSPSVGFLRLRRRRFFLAASPSPTGGTVGGVEVGVLFEA